LSGNETRLQQMHSHKYTVLIFQQDKSVPGLPLVPQEVRQRV